MDIIINRDIDGSDFTAGRLSIPSIGWKCDTLEDKVRNIKIKNKTAIPAGEYKVIITYSKRFKKNMPILINVPGFESIRIHSGNTIEDTSGCVLVGERAQSNTLVNSRKIYNELIQILFKEQNIWLKIY